MRLRVDNVKFSPFYTIQWPGMPEKVDMIEKPKGNFCDHIVNTISILNFLARLSI